MKEAAEQLRLDESTLYRHLREGRFPGVKVGGRYLVPAAVIEELAAGAMAAGHCVDIDEWAAWRDERAASAAGSRGSGGAAMIERLLIGVQRAIAGVVGILVLFALVVGLVLWGSNDPEGLQALVGKLVDAAVALITWLCDLIVRTLDGAGD